MKEKDKLKKQSSALIMIVSCISVLMLITYFSFGFSMNNKGTYSVPTRYPQTEASMTQYQDRGWSCQTTTTVNPPSTKYVCYCYRTELTDDDYCLGGDSPSSSSSSSSSSKSSSSSSSKSSSSSSSSSSYKCYNCYGTYAWANTDLTASGCNVASSYTSKSTCEGNNSSSSSSSSSYKCYNCYGTYAWANTDLTVSGCNVASSYTSKSACEGNNSSADTYTCSVALSCDSTVVASESINVSATVTVYKNGTKLTSGGTAYLASSKWATGGSGYSSGANGNGGGSLYDTQTIYANSAAGQTINTSFTATLTNGKTCTASKTISVVACSNCGTAPTSGCYPCNGGVKYFTAGSSFTDTCSGSPVSGYVRAGTTNICCETGKVNAAGTGCITNPSSSSSKQSSSSKSSGSVPSSSPSSSTPSSSKSSSSSSSKSSSSSSSKPSSSSSITRSCYECDVSGSKMYVYATSTSNAATNTGGSNCVVVADRYCDAPENPKTGTTAIIIAWIVGLTAIGYTLWYVIRSKTIKN